MQIFIKIGRVVSEKLALQKRLGGSGQAGSLWFFRWFMLVWTHKDDIWWNFVENRYFSSGGMTLYENILTSFVCNYNIWYLETRFGNMIFLSAIEWLPNVFFLCRILYALDALTTIMRTTGFRPKYILKDHLTSIDLHFLRG